MDNRIEPLKMRTMNILYGIYFVLNFAIENYLFLFQISLLCIVRAAHKCHKHVYCAVISIQTYDSIECLWNASTYWRELETQLTIRTPHYTQRTKYVEFYSVLIVCSSICFVMCDGMIILSIQHVCVTVCVCALCRCALCLSWSCVWWFGTSRQWVESLPMEIDDRIGGSASICH